MPQKKSKKITAGLLKNLSTIQPFRQTGEFIENAFNSMDDAISIIDTRSLKILYANKKFIKMYGSKNFNVIGQHCYKVTHQRNTPCAPPNDICPLHEVLKTSKYSSAEHIHIDKNGKWQYAEISASPIDFDKNGKATTIIHIAKDITERKQMINRLTESYEHLGIINRKLSLLLDLNRHIQEQSRPEALRHIISAASNISRAFFISLYKTGNDGSFHILASQGLEQKEKARSKKITPKKNKLFSELRILKKIIYGSADNPNIKPLNNNSKLKYFLILPLIQSKKGAVKGFMFFGFTKKQTFSSHELDFYEVFVQQISSFLF